MNLKTKYLLKKLLKWANKKQNFNIQSEIIEHDRLKLVTLGHFLPLKTKKIKTLKK